MHGDDGELVGKLPRDARGMEVQSLRVNDTGFLEGEEDFAGVGFIVCSHDVEDTLSSAQRVAETQRGKERWVPEEEISRIIGE